MKSLKGRKRWNEKKRFLVEQAEEGGVERAADLRRQDADD